MYQIDILEGYFEKKSRKEQLNEQSNTFYINSGISSSIMCADLRNIEIWILKGEGMTVDEENARVEEIRQKVLAFGEAQYIDGLNKGKENIEAERSSYNDGYTKGLEDMWDVWHWYTHALASDVHNLFPEVLKEGYTYFTDFVEKIGLAEAVRRYKEDKKADAQILYSTISDLKADYTKEQILKALKDNDIEVIEVEHE